MSTPDDIAQLEFEQALVVWSLFGLSLTFIIGITYTTLRDLLKYDHEHLSVLKDQYTVFYITFVILSLVFKLAIIDTHIKDEIKNARVCSMFISDYMPQFFIALSSLLVAAKAIMLALVERDTLQTYELNKKSRLQRSSFVLSPIFLVLFILMNFRFTRTCFRLIDVWAMDFIEIRTHIHFVMLFMVKLVCIVCLITCFFLMRKNKYVRESIWKYWGFLLSFFLMFTLFITIISLLLMEIISAHKVQFVALFFIDICFITILTLAVLFFR